MRTRNPNRPTATGHRWSLLGSVATLSLLVAGVAAPAYAADGSADAAAQDTVAAERSQIEQLRAQVEALSARVAEQEAALRRTEDAQAQTTAQVDSISDQVQTAVQAQVQSVTLASATADGPARFIRIGGRAGAGAGSAPASWADNTTISGRMYFDLSHIEQDQDGGSVQPTGTGFDIKRFYLGVDHRFNDIFSANLTMDFQYASAISSTEFYVKKAYLQAKLSDAFVVRLGSTDLPWVPYAEDLYGYRFVENVLVDRTKFGTSADWGIHLSGKLMDGRVNYALAAINGAGYKAPLRGSGMDFEGRISFTPIDHFSIAIGGYSGKLGKEKEGVNTFHTATRFDAIAAYTDDRFRFGVEYFSAQNWNNVLTVASDSSDGYSVFGSFRFNPQFSAFARYDWVDPTKDTDPDKHDDYFNIGVDFSPTRIVDLALVYKRDRVENGFISTSNGTIGGVNDGTYDEIGIFGQLRW